jgi:hypothetical protein
MVDQTIREKPTGTADLDARLVGDLSLTATELIDSIVARHSDESFPKDAFTLKQFLAHTGKTSERTALNMLKDEVESGTLYTELRTVNGHRARIWWPRD